jgi:ABC-type dipeptide/oligopeptide/nickel transport system ATPase component
VIGGACRFGDVDILRGLSDYVTIDSSDGGAVPVVRKNAQRWNAVHHARLAPILGSDVAMMFQDARRSLVPYWTIRQHLVHVLRRVDDPRDPALDAAALMSRFAFRDPGHVLDAFPEQLSGGEAQRAMLAMMMAMHPRLLIADEPTTGLDAINQMRVLDELRRLHAESELAIVLISHDLAVVARVVDYVFVMFGGTVVERAPVSLLTSGSETSLHPYSTALRESQRRRAEGLPISSRVREPDAEPRAVGCPYAGRCDLRPRLATQIQARCDAEFPAEVKVAADHFVSCWGIAS